MYYLTIMNNEQPIRDYKYIICNLYTTACVTTQLITSQKKLVEAKEKSTDGSQ